MRAFVLVVSSLAITSSAWAQAPAPVAQADLVRWMESLTGVREIQAGSFSGRLQNRTSVANRQAAAGYIQTEFSLLGYEAQTIAFESEGYRGQNVVARKANADGKPILFASAHYDSENNAGADDDATGVTALLSAAQSLRNVDLDLDVRFVAFDLEERSLVGSRAFARIYMTEALRRRTRGDIQLEMLGYDSDGDGQFNLVDCRDSMAMNRALSDAVLQAVRPGVFASHGCTTRSDHSSFWDLGIPAVVISQNFFFGDSNPCYHRACDRMDRINFRYFQRLVDLLIRSIVRVAES